MDEPVAISDRENDLLWELDHQESFLAVYHGDREQLERTRERIRQIRAELRAMGWGFIGGGDGDDNMPR